MSLESVRSDILVLKRYENELVAPFEQRLVKFGTLKLSEILHSRGLLDTETCKNLVRINQDTFKPELLVKYLLQLINKYVAIDKQGFSSFIDILVALGWKGLARKLLRSKLVRERQGSVWPEARSMGEYIFCELDIPVLTALLSDKVSDKWESLSMELGLSESEREECKAEASDAGRLCKVIVMWIRSSSICSTWSNLENALQSSRVGCSDIIGSGLKEKVWAEIPIGKQIVGKLEPVCQSSNAAIASGEAALVGFQVSSDILVKYQWSKNNKSLSDNKVYSGTQSPFLFISDFDLQAEGDYKCHASRSDEFISSDEITLLMKKQPKILEIIQSRYSALTEISHPWSSIPFKAFINLAAVQNSDISKFDYTIRGDAYDIIGDKEIIDYGDVFGRYKSGGRIIVTGRPGCGKTTLMNKIAKDWGEKSSLLGATIVILVPLMLVSSKEDLSLFDIVELVVGKHRVKEYMSEIEHTNGKNVCFLFDGLEEFRVHPSSIISQLINKQVLPLAMVIVASDPRVASIVRNNCPNSHYIEIVGFTKQQINAYIYSYFNNDRDARNLVALLDNHVNVIEMCYLPVHIQMICFIYSQVEEIFPHTESSIYELLVFLILKYHGENLEPVINSLQSLTGELRNIFCAICKIAFDMTVESKQHFKESDCDTSISSLLNTGLLVSISSSTSLYQTDDVYAFHHLAIQKYLAAQHLASLDVETLEKVFDVLGDKHSMELVWIFYCGISKLSNFEILKKLFVAKSTEFKVRCAFESQNIVACRQALEPHTNTLSFSNAYLLPTTFLAAIYVICNSEFDITNLAFLQCYLDTAGISVLVDKLNSRICNNIKFLGINDCTSEPGCLNMLLKNLTSLKTLDLLKTKLRSEDIEILTEDVSLPHLTDLMVQLPAEHTLLSLLRFNSEQLELVRFECPMSVSYKESCRYNIVANTYFPDTTNFNLDQKMLFYCNILFQSITMSKWVSLCSKLVLINCGVRDQDLQLLADSMAVFTKLEIFHLDFNSITTKGVALLCDYLKNCSELRVFSAHCNQIDDSGALALLDVLVHLKFLDLQGNPITDKGLADLSEVLKNRGKDLEFYVSITSSLTPYSNLEFMQQSLELICDSENMEAIFRAQQCCKFLPKDKSTDIIMSNITTVTEQGKSLGMQ